MFNRNRKFQLTLNSAGRSSREKRFGKIQLPKGQTEKKSNLWSGKKTPSVKSHDNHQISSLDH